jgi:hypothetical protein
LSGIQKLLDLLVRTEQAEPPLIDRRNEAAYEVEDKKNLNMRLIKLEKVVSTIRGEL